MTLRDHYILDRCSDLEYLLRDAAVWAAGDSRLGANLAAYMSVIIIGVFEDCIENLVERRVGKAGDAEVKNYVTKAVGKTFRNPEYGSINGLLKEFSEDYQRQFKQKIFHDGREASALMSIVDNKNSLAHLGCHKLEMTMKDVTDYYHQIIPILEAMEEILG